MKRGQVSCRKNAVVNANAACKMEIMSLHNVKQFYVEFEATPHESSPNKKSSYVPKPLSGHAMIDSGAMSCFLHSKPIEQFRLPTYTNLVPKRIKSY